MTENNTPPEDGGPEAEVVGYGNPPKHAQFQPGKSGNPKGRPKGVKSLKSVLYDELSRKINLSEQGVQATVTKMEALAKRLVGDALSGNARALSELLRQVNLHMSETETAENKELPASEEDVRLLLKYAKQAVAGRLEEEVADGSTNKF